MSKQTRRAVNGHAKPTNADQGDANMEFVEFDPVVNVARRAIGAIDSLRFHVGGRIFPELRGLNPENKFRVRYLIDLLKCEIEELIRDQVSDSVSKVEDGLVQEKLKPIGSREVVVEE